MSSQVNFSSFDFDFSSMSDFEGSNWNTIWVNRSIKNAVSSALTQYYVLCWL